MVLEEFLKKSKTWVIAPLLGLALVYYPVNNKSYNINTSEEQMSVSPIKVVEEYSLNYDAGIYILGIRFFSCEVDFYSKKVEENGLVKEVMGAYGKYSDRYYGNFLCVVSKDEDPFERQSYLVNYDNKTFQNEAVFYKDKVKIVENGLERMVSNDGFVGLQSVIKPLLTEDLTTGQVFSSKTFLEGKCYDCNLVVEQEETIKIKGKRVKAYRVILNTKGEAGSGKDNAADLWVVEGKPYNKIVKFSFSPFILTEIVASLDS